MRFILAQSAAESAGSAALKDWLWAKASNKRVNLTGATRRILMAYIRGRFEQGFRLSWRVVIAISIAVNLMTAEHDLPNLPSENVSAKRGPGNAAQELARRMLSSMDRTSNRFGVMPETSRYS